MRMAEVFPFAICMFLLLVVTNLIVLAAPASASARALVHEGYKPLVSQNDSERYCSSPEWVKRHAKLNRLSKT